MKHLLLGGCGFTGSHLARALIEAGEEVVICDLPETRTGAHRKAHFLTIDLTDPHSLSGLPLAHDDIVHHLAARQYHQPVPWHGRQQHFDDVNHAGTRHVLELMRERECPNLIYFSTDMVYGFPQRLPVATNHPRNPLGPYGLSKKRAEELCEHYRAEGLRITVLRPRLIVGPGRLGVLAKLFGLIDKGLPVPLIGNGSNHYQMVSVFDCVSAVLCAVRQGIPNDSYNLGSKDPPRVIDLLEALIERAGSRSFLVKTPAWAIKTVLATLDAISVSPLYREQYAIADQHYLIDISKTEQDLGWTPRYRDEDMLVEAFHGYGKRRQVDAQKPD